MSWTELPTDLWRSEIFPCLDAMDRACWAAACRSFWQERDLLAVSLPPDAGVCEPWFRRCVGNREPPWLRSLAQLSRRVPRGVTELRIGGPLSPTLRFVAFVRRNGFASILFHPRLDSTPRERRERASCLMVGPGYVRTARLDLDSGDILDVSPGFDVGTTWRQSWSVARHVRRLAEFWAETLDARLITPWRNRLRSCAGAPCAVTVDTPFFSLEVDAAGSWRYAELTTGSPLGPREWSFSWQPAPRRTPDGRVSPGGRWTHPLPSSRAPSDWEQLVARRLGFSC